MYMSSLNLLEESFNSDGQQIYQNHHLSPQITEHKKDFENPDLSLV